MILALIPARKNSKSVSNKNMKFLAGKPLIHYAITQAKKSKKIDKIVVSSDDKKILEFSKKEHVEIINRPKHLGLDSTSTEKVVIHAINTLEKKGECVDTVIILQPTSPLRNHKDIDGAIRKFQKNKCELLASVKISDVSPYWMYNKNGNVIYEDVYADYLNLLLYIKKRNIFYQVFVGKLNSKNYLTTDKRHFKTGTIKFKKQ